MREVKEKVRCHACNSGHIERWLEGFQHLYGEHGKQKAWTYRLVECKSCGLGFIDPMPDWAMVQTFYSTDYHCYRLNNDFDPKSEYTKYTIARLRFAGSTINAGAPLAFAKRGLAMATEWLSGKTISYSLGIPLQLPLDAKIFEMGYGAGHWLQMMSSLGYKNLYGYDIDANPSSVAVLRSLGINVSTGRFLENKYQGDYFDCIRLEHVFEHLLNPVDVLKKIKSMLKPLGVLVMTFPCKTSWSRELSSRHWGPLEPPVHLYHHTPQSARLMLEQAGLKVARIRPFSVVEQLAGTANNVINSHKHKLPLIGPTVSRAIAPAYRFFGTLTSRGDFLTVWASRGNM